MWCCSLELWVYYVHKGLDESHGSYTGFIIYLFYIYLYSGLEVLYYELTLSLAYW